MSPDPLDYPFWLASRSAGVVAYLLLSSSVVLGLVMVGLWYRGTTAASEQTNPAASTSGAPTAAAGPSRT